MQKNRLKEGIGLSEKTVLATSDGELIPAYTTTRHRKNKYSVQYYKSGKIKAVALEEPQDIQTPIGVCSAELVTFYETGELELLEPAVPVTLKPDTGEFIAFDNNAVGINADVNSLVFDKCGKIISYIDNSIPANPLCDPEACESCSLGCKHKGGH